MSGSPSDRWTRWRRDGGRVVARHWPVLVLLGAAVALRVTYLLAYRPILWYLSDSAVYLRGALQGDPEPTRPIGYSWLLLLLEPLHSLAAVAAVQHALGLGLGLGCYVLAMRFGAPRWAATTAAALLWFEGMIVGLEQVMLGETLFNVLILAALALLAWPPLPPSPVRCAVAGLVVALAVLVRPQAIAVAVTSAAVLVAFRIGWARTLLTLSCWILPVVAYSTWYATQNGSFGLSETGRYLYGKVMTFTDCRVTLPPRERVLCARPIPTPRPNINYYVWSQDSPLQDVTGSRAERSRVAGAFAVHVVAQQPLQYLADVAATFRQFFALAPDGAVLPRRAPPPLPGVFDAYARQYQAGASGDTGLHSPAAVLLRYEAFTRIPGAVCAVLAVLAGAALVRRRGDPPTRDARLVVALAASAALGLILFTALTTEYVARYRVPAIPLLALAAAVSLGVLRPQRPVRSLTGT